MGQKGDIRPARLLGLLAVLASASCASGEGGENVDGGPLGKPTPPALTQCTSNVDCNGGEVCRGEQCREACGTSEECSHDFYRVCADFLGYCVRCVGNEDCATDEVCTNSLCEKGCSEDSDCPGGYECRDRVCTSLDPIVCAAGTERCEGSTVVRCSVDGTMEERAPCGSDEICRVSEGTPECAARVCTPNQIGCSNGTTAFICNSDGTEQTSVSCRNGQICESGVCRNQVCAPDSRTCVGNQQIVCNADGSDFETIGCADGCSSEFGCSCLEGACVERICTPESGQCVATGVRFCNSSGTGWSNPQACDDICVEGLCVASTCTAGQTQCSGDQLLTCNSLGTGYEVTDCSDSDEVCVASGGSASCVGRVCTPDAVRCNSDETAVMVCNPLGTAESQVLCNTGEHCDRGVCLPDQCVPDCSGRNCGPDPVCGESCGPCQGTCMAGQCQAPQNTGLVITLSWSPSSADLDLYLVKETGSACDATTCNYLTCTNDSTRPDWDASGGPSNGDPNLTFASGSAGGPGPETIRIAQPQATSYIAGVHMASTSPASAMATVTFERNGQTLGSVSRTVNTNELWKGITVDLSQASPSPAAGTVEADFTGCSAAGCTTDDDCASNEYCSLAIAGFPGTCAVGCRSSADCAGNLRCAGDHQCSTMTAVWGAACAASADCEVGLYCSPLQQTCQERCDMVGSCLGDPSCCPTSNALFCAQGLLFGICSNTP